jgi:lysophospholipase L1-like esterase
LVLLLSVTVAINSFAWDGDYNQGRAYGHKEWVGTWSASPESLSTYPVPPTSFNNQTLRQIVRTSIGGKQARVRLSNAFGTKPLVIGAARIALRDSGAAIKGGSDRQLTFSGQPSIIIPQGALVLSDPVELNVPALGDLVVSIYLPGDTGLATTHTVARQTNYYSSSTGDFTASLNGTPFDQTVTRWYFLSGVEVTPYKHSRAIVALGDSITDGYSNPVLGPVNCIPDKNSRWPDELARRLQTHHYTIGVLNAGIAGNRLLHEGVINSIFGQDALARFDRDVLAQTGVSYVILLEGINDIGHAGTIPNESVSAQDIIAALQQIIDRAHVRGIKVIGCTLTPFKVYNTTYYTPAGEAKRQAINDWIRTSGEFDGVVDFDAVVRDPNDPQRLLPIYDSGDHLHPNDAGYKAMGDAIDLSLFKHYEMDCFN